MKNLFQRYILVLCFVVLSISQTFAIENITSVELKNSSSNTIELEWEEVEKSYWYYISYGTKSGVVDWYESEYVDLLEKSAVTLSELEADTEYFVLIMSVDENGDEIAKSKELQFTTAASDSLKLLDSEVISNNYVELQFNVNIDREKNITFILKGITKAWEIAIDDIKVSEKTVMLRREWTFVPGERYELILVDIYWENGQTITSWIDGAVTFIVPDFDTVEENENTIIETLDSVQEDDAIVEEAIESMNTSLWVNELSSSENIENMVEEEMPDESLEIELNAPEMTDPKKDFQQALAVNTKSDAKNNSNTSVEKNSQEDSVEKVTKSWANLAGSEVDEKELEKHTSVVAEKTTDLPTTWPESILLILWSLIIAFVMFYFGRVRKM